MDMDAQLQQGVKQAARVGVTDLGGVLKYALLARFTEERGAIAEIRSRLRAHNLTRAALRRDAEDWLPSLLQAACKNSLPASELLNERPDLQARVIELALDALESELLAPDLELAFAPVHLPDIPVHALVFSAMPHVTNELYPLLVDAYVAGLAQHGRPFQVVGIHEDWLVAGSFRRAIIFDAETKGLIEADIAGSPRIGSAQVLALNLREEQESHQRIERALPGVVFTNPYAGTAKLDDKTWTGTCWQQAGLPTPRFLRLSSGLGEGEIFEELRSFAAAYGETLIVKPVGGTEGRGVFFYEADSRPQPIMSALQDGDTLVSEVRGTVRYAGENGPVRCTVRLNCCWDGAQAHVESGYAQVAGSPGGIASAGCGGRVIALDELWRHLCRADGTLIVSSTADWQHLCVTAADGVRVLAAGLNGRMPALVGIDLLLDIATDGELLPVLLEANGRPSGMGHSRFVSTTGPTAEPGVSLRLWEVVRNMLKDGPHPNPSPNPGRGESGKW